MFLPVFTGAPDWALDFRGSNPLTAHHLTRADEAYRNRVVSISWQEPTATIAWQVKTAMEFLHSVTDKGGDLAFDLVAPSALASAWA